MRMYRTTPEDLKLSRIEHVLHIFGMTDMQQRKAESLSSGERRKLNIAIEFLTDPYFLLCDEPITDLDNINAMTVMESLKELTTPNESKMKSIVNKKCVKISDLHTLSYGHGSTSIEMNAAHSTSNFIAKGIACSVHEPSSEIFNYFTHIILMNSGRIIFHGSTKEAKIFFSK